MTYDIERDISSFMIKWVEKKVEADFRVYDAQAMAACEIALDDGRIMPVVFDEHGFKGVTTGADLKWMQRPALCSKEDCIRAFAEYLDNYYWNYVTKDLPHRKNEHVLIWQFRPTMDMVGVYLPYPSAYCRLAFVDVGTANVVEIRARSKELV